MKLIDVKIKLFKFKFYIIIGQGDKNDRYEKSKYGV